jgi:hypothetical protein
MPLSLIICTPHHGLESPLARRKHRWRIPLKERFQADTESRSSFELGGERLRASTVLEAMSTGALPPSA